MHQPLRTNVRALRVRESHDDAFGVVGPRRGHEARGQRGWIDGQGVVAGHLVVRAARDAGEERVPVVPHGAEPAVDRGGGAADGRAVGSGERLVAQADAQDREGGAVEEQRQADADVGAFVGGPGARRDHHCGAGKVGGGSGLRRRALCPGEWGAGRRWRRHWPEPAANQSLPPPMGTENGAEAVLSNGEGCATRLSEQDYL